MFLLGKMLQALGFAHVGIGLYLGVVRDDMWKELYLALSGVAFFWLGRHLFNLKYVMVLKTPYFSINI